MMNYSEKIIAGIIPEVVRKGGNGGIIKEPFNVNKIISSLERETTLEDYQIKVIVESFFQFIVPHDFKFVTAPMIREILCFMMLSNGLDKNRHEYTRIGLPFSDITELTNSYDFERKIIDHVNFEYGEVKKIIDSYTGERND